MNIRDLEYFVAVAQQQHFNKASRQCAVSQPTLSMQLQKLENSLGVKLFERSNKAVSLTPSGEELLPLAKNILGLVDEINQRAKSLQDKTCGSLKIGIFPTLGPYILPIIVPIIRKEFPALKLFLREEKTAEIVAQLKDRNLDCAILSLPLNEESLEYFELFEESFSLAVPKNHLLAGKKNIGKDEIFGEQLLLLEDGHCMRDQVLEFCRATQSAEFSNFRATSLETLRQMVAADAGVTLIPKLAIKPDKNIKYLSFRNPVPKRKIVLCYRKNFYKLELLKEIADLIQRGATTALNDKNW